MEDEVSTPVTTTDGEGEGVVAEETEQTEATVPAEDAAAAAAEDAAVEQSPEKPVEDEQVTGDVTATEDQEKTIDDVSLNNANESAEPTPTAAPTDEDDGVTQANQNETHDPIADEEQAKDTEEQVIDDATSAQPAAATEDEGTAMEPSAEPAVDINPRADSPEGIYDSEANITGQATQDDQPISDLGVGPSGTLQLDIQSADPHGQPLKPFKPREEYLMPDIITVRVPGEGDAFNEVVVEIERTNRKKPFLGGFRHKVSAIEFHHASAQTVSAARPPTGVQKFCRDTQTSEQRHCVAQTTSHTSTQMTKIGCYVSNMQDKLITPGKYVTADEHRARVLSQVVVIQKYYRRWLASRYVLQVRDDKARRLDWEREEEVRKKKDKEDRIRREFARRMNPETKEDFDLLYHALEKWRQEETARIDASLSGAERKAALCALLEQETQLMASIGRHRNVADVAGAKRKVQAFLDKAALPKQWKGGDGKLTHMDTPYTLRAQQLRDIYASINMKHLTQDERLDVLLTLKHTVKEHDCKLTKEIVELIDREADLLMRGIREASLDGLRRRIATLFLQYIKTPEFNPEAARLLKVPPGRSLKQDVYFCAGCQQYLACTEFQLASNSRTAGRCRACTKTDNDARGRQDHSHYGLMLRALRRQEEAHADGARIAFLLQEQDLRHLVENVWSSQSALSAWDDLYDLALVRWDAHAEWAPWNCVLLTKEEATAHAKLDNMDEAYGRTFIHRVKHKHTLARSYFSRLPGMAEHMRDRASAPVTGRAPSVTGKKVQSPLAITAAGS